MANIWDKLKGLLTPGGAAARKELETQVRDAMLRRVATKTSFTALDVANEVTAPNTNRTAEDLQEVSKMVDVFFEQKLLEPFSYYRAWQRQSGNYLYNPYVDGPAPDPGTPATAVRSTVSMRAPTVNYPAPAVPATLRPPPKDQNPYAADPEIMALSAEETRKRSLRINPGQTAWIGRTDTIPPQSDERTALIDRGLVLRGLLNERQLVEIHTVGDLWLKHHQADKLATIEAGKNAQQVLDVVRQQRAELKAKKKEQSAARAKQRAEEIAARHDTDIIYLGRGVSKGLADRRSNVERLQAQGLPVLSTPMDVAQALELKVPQLRWLCFHTDAATRTHYVYFEIPKRSGGKRLLAAPHAKLAKAQEWILRNLLDKLPTESPAHGFIRGRSTVTNATEHLKQDVVVNLDLSDFFPTITFRRVRGVFQRLGYSPAVATVLALLCTESPRRRVEYDGKKYWVAVSERALPQGACTSPALSNQIARKLDRRLRGRFAKLGWKYTRYADDLTFSAEVGKRGDIPRIWAVARHVVQEEGFTLNPKKGRVQARANRQSVTGIVVNDRLSIPREEVRQLRAILHGARKTGLDAQNRENRPHFRAWVQGKIAYLCMVDREKGIKYLRELEALPKS